MNEAALEQAHCPLCSKAGEAWTRRFGRELRRCRACGFAWVLQGLTRAPSGRSLYEDEMWQFDEYADYYEDESTIEAARDKLRWIADHTRAGGRLLDVGANVGYFSTEASTRYEVTGIEPSAGTVARGRAQLQAPIEVGSIYDERPDFHGRFDVIAMFDVLEHLPDPRGALDRCHDYLAPGGRLFITTPDLDSVMARLLGSHWYYVDLIQHIALFGRSNLRALLEERGFSLVSRRTIGRQYRISYIERRLRTLAAETAALKVAHLASRPLLRWPDALVSLNLGDVMGIAAEATATGVS